MVFGGLLYLKNVAISFHQVMDYLHIALWRTSDLKCYSSLGSGYMYYNGLLLPMKLFENINKYIHYQQHKKKNSKHA